MELNLDKLVGDLNYELGKAKEVIVTEKEAYIGNMKTDASLINEFIKVESTRLNKTYFGGKLKIPALTGGSSPDCRHGLELSSSDLQLSSPGPDPANIRNWRTTSNSQLSCISGQNIN